MLVALYSILRPGLAGSTINPMKEIALALGGGGSKGYAHIGVLRALDRHGFKVRAIAGTSAGGLVGSLYAYGYTPDEIQRRILAADPAGLYRRQPGDGPAWLGTAGIRQMLAGALGDCEFADLHIPFAVPAVDLNRAEYVVLNNGPVIDAILATIAVPGVFPPACLDGRTLVDGGVLDPVPVGLARSLAPDLPVVAVVLSPPIDDWGGLTQPRLLGSLPFLTTYIERLSFVQALNVFMRSIDIGGALMTELLLQVDPPDVLLRPAVRAIGLLDTVEVADVAGLGERAVERALPELERLVAWPQRLKRRLRRRRLLLHKQPQVRLPYKSDFPVES